jgi:hypothetical protein
MAKETAADRLHGKRKPRDPGPDREWSRKTRIDLDDRTHAHHRHGGGLLQDLDRDEPA